MKNIFHTLLLHSLILLNFFAFATPRPLDRAGFALPDSLTEFSLHYESVENLIVLPVRINNSLQLNLILDTGCRNLVLFGKKFNKHFSMEEGKVVKFSGLGSGAPIEGTVSLNNQVSIGAIIGERIPIVVVPQRNLFVAYDNIHGVIGYDIFLKFQIEIDPMHKMISFRSAASTYVPVGFTKIPIDIVDARPVLNSTLKFGGSKDLQRAMMIDTGSSLGLLLKSTDVKSLSLNGKIQMLGRGLNGSLEGILATSQSLVLEGYEILNLPTGIVESQWHNYASIGMDVLKDYGLIINYVMGYACLKKMDKKENI